MKNVIFLLSAALSKMNSPYPMQMIRIISNAMIHGRTVSSLYAKGCLFFVSFISICRIGSALSVVIKI